MLRHIRPALIGLSVVVGICTFVQPAHAQKAVFHGMSLGDGVNHLIIEQKYDICRIGITSREREWGPYSEANTGDISNESPRTEVRYLVQVRSRIIKPSAPNYLQNPGYFYHFTVETLDLWPPYAIKLDVDADNAREAMMYQLQRIALDTPDRKAALAISKASTLILDIFKNTNLMPAEIYKSVLLSRSGLYRIIPGIRQRREIAPSQLFAPDMEIDRPELGATQREAEANRLPRLAAKPYSVGLPDPESRFSQFPFVTTPQRIDAFTERYGTGINAARNPIYRTGGQDADRRR